ncbi:DNA-directed RNA polymerase subunit alpha C-terminal domain-containing protein [Bradyrhizobium zhanjiangense]|uniref:RNA polymerase alpha subunit C-terminal domain-containing protein n=1 Tax=Bradyrhizobium zhanjiangense TaxID=1325107 RepID=A0ABY0DH61_9BRAD|nr:DNA-directed RNA polymerase subunit alpha C-terminal domain-containing protein [Bradyrhizobium zhanjiangense]RXG91545.1 hypothetical protein EAS62_23995 [Bradyrhizobium zhanjiangense]
MTDQTEQTGTSLAALAENAAASGAWWTQDALETRSPLELPTRVLNILDNAGIRTVDQLKAQGPQKLRKLEGIGKQGFEQIVALLRALDRQANGGET